MSGPVLKKSSLLSLTAKLQVRPQIHDDCHRVTERVHHLLCRSYISMQRSAGLADLHMQVSYLRDCRRPGRYSKVGMFAYCIEGDSFLPAHLFRNLEPGCPCEMPVCPFESSLRHNGHRKTFYDHAGWHCRGRALTTELLMLLYQILQSRRQEKPLSAR